MRRVTNEEIVFYDHVARRINGLLGSRSCTLTQSSLAERIGWNRASLCNFVNRIDKSIAAHFIPRIAGVFKVSVDHLMNGDCAPAARRNNWDPRSDDVAIILQKMNEIRRRDVRCICLKGMLPLMALPNRAMIANFVDSMVGGISPAAAERWHEMIEALRDRFETEGAENLEYLIPLNDLRRLPRRQPPYQGFTDDEAVHMLEQLKSEWVHHRGLRIIALKETELTPEAKLELASNISLTVVGRETQICCRRDLRIEWGEDFAAVQYSRDCLIRLKRSAGYGLREQPSVQRVERLIDELLLSVKSEGQRPRISKYSGAGLRPMGVGQMAVPSRQLIA